MMMMHSDNYGGDDDSDVESEGDGDCCGDGDFAGDGDCVGDSDGDGENNSENKVTFNLPSRRKRGKSCRMETAF